LVEQEGWTVRWKPRGLFPEVDAVHPPDEKGEIYGFNYGARVNDIIAVLKNKPPE
jgi:hypothetical protein